ncbi:MAG: ABC transporter substrate-binding protein, partial [Anaerolineales bacterium]
MKVWKVLFVVVVVLLFAVTACAPQAEEPAVESAPAEEEAPAEEAQPMEEESHTLVIAMNIDDLITLDPAWAGETTNQLIHANTYDTLIEYAPGDYVDALPKLAESWEAAEGAMEFTFKLKPDLQFSSGNPITSKDVEFSWLRGKYMQNWFFDPIESFEIIDDLTFKVKLQYPSADFYAIVTIPGLGITDSEVVMAHGGNMDEDAYETDTAKEWLDQQSAGSAPYVLSSWAQKSEVVLDANPNYWGEQPYFDKVVIKHVEDPTTMVQMLQKGDADLVPGVDIDLVDMVEADDNLHVVISQTQDMNYLAMTSNCATEIGPET